MREIINGIYVDQLKHFFKDVSILINESESADIPPLLEAINLQYGHFLKTIVTSKNDLENPKFEYTPKRISSIYLVKNSIHKPLSLKVFDKYVYYSKFEHLGILTYQFYERIHTNLESEIVMFKESLELIILTNRLISKFTGCDESTLEIMENHSNEMLQKIRA